MFYLWTFLKLSTRSVTIFLHTNYIITGCRVKTKTWDTYYITSYLIVHSLYYLKEKHQTETTCICTCNVWCATRLCYGPSLFLFYINDIPDGITSTICLFADDTIANLTIKSNRDCNKLQNDFDKLSIWEQKWKMVLTSLLLQNSFILSRTYILTIIRNAPLSFLNIYFNE